ncbi:hypothetical protein D3C87_1777110 [compost metagenome]
MCPVMAAAGNNSHASRLDVHGQPIAIPLDLKSPIRTDRWSCLEQGQAWLNPIGHRIEWKVRLRRIALAARLRFCRKPVVL